jgi:alanine racemase
MSETADYRCWAEISVDALRHNAAFARARLAADVQLLAVIKANAYGHGLPGVAQALAAEAQLFGVANLHEAIETRAVVPHPVIILGPALPSERADIVARGFIASVSSFEEASEFTRCAPGSHALLDCVIDTGMGRMGIDAEDAVDVVQKIAALPNVTIHSVSSHLPSADSDQDYTAAQLARIRELVARLRAAVPGTYLVHTLPSAGVLSFASSAFDVVRAGLMLYGIAAPRDYQPQLRPALTWKTRVVLVRDVPAGTSISYGRTFTTTRPTRVATLSVGYADGFPRILSNRGAAVLIRGRRCSLLGRVTMDLIMADVTDLPNVATGDEVVLLGTQGGEQILATDLADLASTIPWEIFTRIGTRVARVYV